jgi:hypothetical protein
MRNPDIIFTYDGFVHFDYFGRIIAGQFSRPLIVEQLYKLGVPLANIGDLTVLDLKNINYFKHKFYPETNITVLQFWLHQQENCDV